MQLVHMLQVRVRLGFMLFCGLDLHMPAPDVRLGVASAMRLIKGGVYDDLLRRSAASLRATG